MLTVRGIVEWDLLAALLLAQSSICCIYCACKHSMAYVTWLFCAAILLATGKTKPCSNVYSKYHQGATCIIGKHAGSGLLDQLSNCQQIAEASNAAFSDVTPEWVSAGSYDRFLNLQIALIISMQLLMCLFCSLASYIWREHSGKERYYLGMNEYVQVN